MATGTRRLRMVMYGGIVPTASLYASDASAYSQPVVTFHLSPLQELPLIEPGGVVDVADDFSEIVAAGVVIRPLKKVGRLDNADVPQRIFAERGSVLVNPQTPGWEHTWRDMAPASTQTVETYERSAKRDIRNFRVFVAIFSLYVIVAVILLITTGRTFAYGWYTFGAASGTAAMYGAWRQARKTTRTLAAARAAGSGPTIAMTMRLWWTVGYGHGPVTVASLQAAGAADSPSYEMPVVGVPAGALPTGSIDVDVRGDPAAGATPIITWGTTTLWPIDAQLQQPPREELIAHCPVHGRPPFNSDR